MKKIAVVILMALGSITFLSAGRFEVSLSGGFFTHKWKSGNAVLGISPGFRISNRVSIETGFFHYISATNDYYSSQSLSEVGLSVLVGLIPYKEKRTVVPYLALGPALFWRGNGRMERPQWAVGGGLNNPLSKRVGLRLDIRYFFPLIADDEYPAFRNLWRATIGVSYRL